MRQIKNISFKKDEIILAIDEEKLIIDKNIFAEHYLYLGKQLSNEECDVIKNEISLIEIRKKYLKKLLKKRLSKQEVINLLQNEKLNIKQINYLITFFENNYLLNDKVLEKFKSELGINEGESTKDKMFHLQSVRCVGCCGLAPVCVVNGKTYGRMTPEMVPEILAEWRKAFEEE